MQNSICFQLLTPGESLSKLLQQELLQFRHQKICILQGERERVDTAQSQESGED